MKLTSPDDYLKSQQKLSTGDATFLLNALAKTLLYYTDSVRYQNMRITFQV